MRVQTVIKNLLSAALVNDLLSSGDEVVLWRDSVTGFMWIRLDNGTDVPIGFSGQTVLVGGLNPAGNIDYPVATKGQWWFFTADGSIGAPAINVNEGDTLTAIADSAGGAGAVADFVLGEHNILQASEVVVGVSRFSTFVELVAGVLDNVGVSPQNLIDLLQTTGIESLKTDLLEAKDDAPMTIRGFDSAAEGDDGNDINFQGGNSTAGTGVTNGSNSGNVFTRSRAGGDADTGIGGDSGAVSTQSSAGGTATGAGSAGGNSGPVSLNSQQGGNGVATGGNSGLANVQTGDGGDSSAAGGAGGNAGNVNLIGGDGGADTEGSAGTGGDGADVILRAGAGGAGDTPGNDGFVDIQGLTKESFDPALVALVGGGQAGATPILTKHNRFTTVLVDGQSGLMPKAIPGVGLKVVNASGGGFSLDAFPRPGEQFVGSAINIATALADGVFFEVFCYDLGFWSFE